jgi:hypothetical protein
MSFEMGFSLIFSKVGLNTIHSSGVIAPLTIFSTPTAVDYDHFENQYQDQ